MSQNIIFGIDVSSRSSTVCVVIDRVKQAIPLLLLMIHSAIKIY